MTRKEYEERRRAFEEQHRADVALMNAAQETRIRSLDRLWQEGLDGERLAGAPVPPAPSPSPDPKPTRPRNSVINELEDALPQLPQVFDRQDIVRVLGYKPAPTTLFRTLNRLRQEGVIAPENYSEGGTRVRYRKLT